MAEGAGGNISRFAVARERTTPTAGWRAAAGAPLRVLLVAPEPFYDDRGTPIAVLNVLRALRQLDYRVDVVTYPVGRPIKLPGVKVIRSANPFRIRHVPIGFSFRKLALDATLVPAIWRRLRRRRYHCIHAVEEAAFPAVLLGHLYGVPVIYDMQSSLPEQLSRYRAARGPRVQRVLRAIEAWLLRRVDTVVSSAGLLQRVTALAPATPVREWHFPIDPSPPSLGGGAARRRELGIAPEASVVLYTGTFEPYQGLPLLLDAAPKVLAQMPGAVFVLVGGEGEGAHTVRRDAARRGLNGSMRLLGRLPREEMPDFLAMADVLVSPRSYGGNLPLKVFDYLAAGRPIVATDVPSHRAMLDESRAVLAAPTSDALADSIVALLADPARADSIARASQAYAIRYLGWHRFVLAVHAVYQGVAQRAGARALA